MLTKLQKIDKIISEPKGKRIYGIIAGSDNFFHEIHHSEIPESQNKIMVIGEGEHTFQLSN